jgi:hypothetical protein
MRRARALLWTFWPETSLFIGGWALTLLLIVRGWLSWLPSWLFAYAATVAVALMVVHRLVVELRRLATERPSLRFVGTDWDEVTVCEFNRAGEVGRSDGCTFVRVVVANDPGERAGTTATQVVATISVRDTASRAVLIEAMQGRWASTPQGPELRRIGIDHESRAIDIPANGATEQIDIAMRVNGDASCYAYNNDNTRRSDLGLGRMRAHELVGTRFTIEVAVKGANTPTLRGAFELSAPASSDEVLG